jgi:hypothetical protein
MASNIHILESVRDDWLDRLNTLLGSGCYLRIYDGTQPANADTAKAGNTTLAELALDATPFAAASGGAIAIDTVTDDTAANATGTASWASIENGAGTVRYIDLSVGTSGADLNFNSVSFEADALVSVSSWTLTLAA